MQKQIVNGLVFVAGFIGASLSPKAISDALSTGFVRPTYAPQYVPPVAEGEAIAVVDASGSDLAGVWSIRLDNEKKPIGEAGRWFEQAGFKDKIRLPDALQNCGFGSEVTVDTKWMGVSGFELWLTEKYDKYRVDGNVKVPFFLQSERRFIGDAWYQKTIDVKPGSPVDKDLILTLERPHWSTEIWFNGKRLGENLALGVPHVYNLGRVATGRHNLVVKVDNRLILPVGSRAHSVSDETQGAWNGIIGDIRIDWRDDVHIQNVKIETDYKTKRGVVTVLIENASGKNQSATLKVQGVQKTLQLAPGQNTATVPISFPREADLWSEFHPVLHDVSVDLVTSRGKESKTVRVGIRNIEAKGRKFYMNGHETFMRGHLDCAIFPLTGYPPMTKDEWLVHLGKMKDSGINHVRFHSWCPPKAAFEAGDELGMYLMPEVGIWGDPSNEKFGGWVEEEGLRILDAYGNHPSFMFFTHGNEPWRTGKNKPFLSELTKRFKEYDARMLHTASAGTIQTENDDFTVTGPKNPRYWKGVGYSGRHKNPHIQHEPGQWCAYPNFSEMAKYTGSLKPKNFEIFLEQAEENGVLHQWEDFVQASGKLQAMCYKQDCEAALISEGIGGTQLLGIADFSGQGTSLVGYLDAFYDEKGYFTKEAFSKFWAPMVPIARMGSYIYKQSDVIKAPVVFAYFEEGALKDQTLAWKVVDTSGQTCKAGELTGVTLEGGRNQVGEIVCQLEDLEAPAEYKLVLSLKGSDIDNEWPFYVYEDDPRVSYGGVEVYRTVDESLESSLNQGKSVLFIPQDFSRAHPNLSLEPVFWNRFLFSDRKDRVTLGLLLDEQHPVFGSFPVRFHTTWAWEEILKDSYGLVMQDLPKGEGMIVQPIDDWNENRYLGYLFEYKVGAGRMLVCMPDLLAKQEKDPAARQLLASIVDYMNSSAFAPKAEASLVDFSNALAYSTNKSKMMNLGASIESVSHSWRRSHSYVIDGNAGTQWNGQFKDEAYVTIDLGKTTSFQGVSLSSSTLREIEIYVGDDLGALERVVLRDGAAQERESMVLGESGSKGDQRIGFAREVSGRYLQVKIKSVYGTTVKLGELDVIFVFM